MQKSIQYLFADRLNNSAFKMGLIFSSRILTAILGIIFLPLYIKYLGVESYGLVAFYATLAGALSILGTGLSSSTNREMSILKAGSASPRRLACFLYSVELINWLIACIAGIVIIILSSFIAKYWVNSIGISIPVIRNSIIIMGLIFACQLPFSIYEGAMNGVHKQGVLAIVNIVFAIIKSIGVILVLEFVSSDITTFFLWQLLITVGTSITARALVYKVINPTGEKKFFSFKLLGRIKKYALGITGITLVTFFISQIDKIIVSKFLLLEYVGYYNIAFVLASVLSMIAVPLQTIALPKFNTLEAQGKHKELVIAYFKVSRWMTTLVMPVGLMLIVFSYEVLFLWTRNEVLAQNTSPIFKVIGLGTIFNSIASVFYLYTLAKGNTRYGFFQNLFCIILIVPLLIILTKNYGAIGAAYCWLIYNTMLLTISLPFFHNLYMKNKIGYWFRYSFITPTVLAVIISFSVKFFQNKIIPDINFLELGLLFIIALSIYSMVMEDTRLIILNLIEKCRKYISKESTASIAK